MKIAQSALIAATLFLASPCEARPGGRFGSRGGRDSGAQTGLGMMGGNFDMTSTQLNERLAQRIQMGGGRMGAGSRGGPGGQMGSAGAGFDLASIREQAMARREQMGGSRPRGGKGRGRKGKGRGKGKGLGAETIEVCMEEVSSFCDLDFQVTGLLDAMSALEEAKEAAMAAKEEMSREEWMAARESFKPEKMPEEVKKQVKEVMTCLKELTTDEELDLPEDNPCMVQLAEARQGGRKGGRHGGRGKGKGRGKGGEKVEAVLTACADEIDFDCSLDMEAAELLSIMQSRREAKEELAASKDDMTREEFTAAMQALKPAGDDPVKLALEGVRQCLATIKPGLAEDSECLAAMPSKGKKPPTSVGDPEEEDEREDEVSDELSK